MATSTPQRKPDISNMCVVNHRRIIWNTVLLFFMFQISVYRLNSNLNSTFRNKVILNYILVLKVAC